MKRPLQELLNRDPNADNESDVENNDVEMNEQIDEQINEENFDQNMCIECGDQPKELKCLNCDEEFCKVCHNYLHRTGKRKEHKTEELKVVNIADKPAEAASSLAEAHEQADKEQNENEEQVDEERENANIANNLIDEQGGVNGNKELLLKRIKDHCRFIPMRLTPQERKMLRLLEAALNVSEYTDKVDVLMFSSKAKRMIAQLKEMCSILSGLVVASDMKEGQELIKDKEFAQNAEWFQAVFELGRRYKIMNPEKMRDTFGKLMYMIMDSRLTEVKDAMEFDLYKPIKTVYYFLEYRDALGLLDDPLVLEATVEIVPEGKMRSTIQREIKTKEQAIEKLARRYKNSQIDSESIRQCLYSIGDYHAYLRANCYPVEQILSLLESNFDSSNIDPHYPLGISAGMGGARLSHSHFKQYHYVKQSLTLWSLIMRDMFMLWYLADQDLCNETKRYSLRDTGQGLNRVKDCPFVSRAMHGIIRKAQERCGGKWIGSSVVHLGDSMVPNALMFLDKYLQVPRILTPVYLTLNTLDEKTKDPYVRDWIEAQHGSLQNLQKHIMCDFFKHAFDGSGANDFFSAGSCVDGRLTSTWNWSNTIHKKNYYNKFLVTGFVGFDGLDGF